MRWGQVEDARIDIAAGAPGPFAPPAGWEGDDADYLVLMRRRYRSDPGAAQEMTATARRLEHTRFEGPWAEAARRIAERIRARGAHNGQEVRL
jgi:hypothetical protein